MLAVVALSGSCPVGAGCPSAVALLSAADDAGGVSTDGPEVDDNDAGPSLGDADSVKAPIAFVGVNGSSDATFVVCDIWMTEAMIEATLATEVELSDSVDASIVTSDADDDGS
jgi:hypothetical protein